MGARRQAIRLLVPLLFCLVVLVPTSAWANPVGSSLSTAREAVVIVYIYGLIVLLEGAVIKLALFGVEGPSWPRALLLAVALNAASAIIGLSAGFYFDYARFSFRPHVFAVLGVSLGVEGVPLVLLFARWRLRRAAIAAVGMNLASYLVMVLLRLPA
jgi:hypothetical protein